MANEFTTNFSTFNIVVGSDNNLWFTEPDGPAIGQVTTAGAVKADEPSASALMAAAASRRPIERTKNGSILPPCLSLPLGPGQG